MFLGTYNHQIDQKNRIRVPAKFKSELGSDFVITKGTSGCLFVVPGSSNGLFEKIAALPLFDKDAQKSARLLLSSAFVAEEDGQGRVLLPKELLLHAKIVKDIVFVGVGQRVEIWAKEVWEEYQNADFDSAAEILNKFGV